MSTNKIKVPKESAEISNEESNPQVAPAGRGKNGGIVRAFTYVGGGYNSPQIINFMGRQEFVRGKLTEVTDPYLLAKLPGVTTFVEGTADAELIHKIDQEGNSHYNKQRKEDAIVNARYSKKHVGE